jgi:hypothetical protein
LPSALAWTAGLCLLGQMGVIEETIGARRAGREIVIVERLDPEMNGAGVAFERVRLNVRAPRSSNFGGSGSVEDQPRRPRVARKLTM